MVARTGLAMSVMPVQQAFDTAVRHHQAGQFFEAEKLYRQIIAAHPDHAESYIMLAKLGQHFGRHSDALALVRKAIAINSANAEFHSLEGDLLVAADQVEEAVETLRRAARLQPDSPAILVQLGYALKENNAIEEGIAAFERALRLAPNFAPARWGLSQLRLLKGDFEHGWEDYEARRS
jgi:protein O-GlcNAc transferase